MNAMSQAIALRLPMPVQDLGVSTSQWKVLTEAIWPGAKTSEGVTMAIEYCRARKLDPFKRPVHVVPVWNSSLGREVETVWPSINELQTTAARTGQWAGMDAPEWGPMITRTFEGSVGKRGQESKVKVEVIFPEWCSVTVWRLIHGQRCAFCEPVYWMEAYGRMGRSAVPSDMWQKRVRGQLHKNAKAASLRAAFPEETGNDYTSDEMEGQVIAAGGVVIDHEPLEPTPEIEAPKGPTMLEKVQARLDMCKTLAQVQTIEDVPSVQKALHEAPDGVVRQIHAMLAAARQRVEPAASETGKRDVWEPPAPADEADGPMPD